MLVQGLLGDSFQWFQISSFHLMWTGNASAIEAELQAKSAFLPISIACSHVEKVAAHLVKAISSVAKLSGTMDSHSATLNNLLGV